LRIGQPTRRHVKNVLLNITAVLRAVIAMMAVVASRLALDATLWNIAIQRARLRIGQPTRRHVKNVLRNCLMKNCLMKNCSSSLRQMKIALSAICDSQSIHIKERTSHAAVKCCVAVVSMHTRLLQQIQEDSNSNVSSVELKQSHQTRRILKD
jgi:DNA polymerase III epsilon subunit-like protein